MIRFPDHYSKWIDTRKNIEQLLEEAKSLPLDERIMVDRLIEIRIAVLDAYHQFIPKERKRKSFVFKYNKRHIELSISNEDNENDIKYELYCPETEIERIGYVFLEHDEESGIRDLILGTYTSTWEIFTPEVYAIKTDDITMQIKELIQIINVSCDFCAESYWSGQDDGREACIIEIKDKRIYANFWVDDVNEDEYDVYFECTETERGLYLHIDSKVEEVAHEIQKFALEPQISEILASNYGEEYEQIKEIIVPAIYVCPYATSSTCKDSEKRTIMLNNKQIMIILKCEDKVNASPNERPYYISASIECITTGRSKSCLINPFDKNPTELIRKIQEFAWEDDYRRYPM